MVCSVPERESTGVSSRLNDDMSPLKFAQHGSRLSVVVYTHRANTREAKRYENDTNED
jgi:hypothetical protein